MKVLEDDEILKLIADPRQEERGFKLLINKYQKPLYWHIMRMVNNHEDANDVLQNTSIKVYRGINRFEQNSKLYTWLYKIASNESISFINKRKRKQTVDIESVNTVSRLKAEETIDADRVVRKLQSAVSTLPEKQKIVFNMRYYDEMTYKQISEILGTSVGGLKASYHHAVKKIESFLKQEE